MPGAVKKAVKKAPVSKNGNKEHPAVSELGKKLQRISDQIAASGEKPLTRRELEREIRRIRFD